MLELRNARRIPALFPLTPSCPLFSPARRRQTSAILHPSIAHNAPSFFNLGMTPVTFTASDQSLNASSCLARVTVVDTTPPGLFVSGAGDCGMHRTPRHRRHGCSAVAVFRGRQYGRRVPCSATRLEQRPFVSAAGQRRSSRLALTTPQATRDRANLPYASPTRPGLKSRLR